MKWTAVVVSAALTCSAISMLQAATEDDVERLFQSFYGDDLEEVAKTRDEADDVALAAKMLETARDTLDEPAFVARLCQEAAKLGAADPSGYETALAAAKLLETQVPERADACRESLLEIREAQYRSSRGRDRVAAGEAYARLLLEAATDRAEAGEHGRASRLYRKAVGTVRAVRSPLVKEVQERIDALQHLRKVDGRIDILKKRLQAQPKNVEARNELIRLLAIDRDDPAAAEAFLTDACDEALRKYVPAAVKPPAEAPELACLELGDWYREMASEAHPSVKRRVLSRARAYFERFLSLHEAEDLKRKRADLTLRQIDAELEKLGGVEYAKGRWIDLLRRVDLEKDIMKLVRDDAECRRTRSGLTFEHVYAACLRLPIIPKGSYELEFICSCKGRSLFGAVVPVADWKMKTWGIPKHNLLEPRCGKGAIRIGIPTNLDLHKPGRPYAVRLRVLRAGKRSQVHLFLNGKQVNQWTGTRPEEALSIGKDKAGPCPEISVANGNVTFHRARLRMLTGKAVPLRKSED